MDFEKHNEEMRAVWDAFHAGKPTRVPVVLGINPRILILNSQLNTSGVTFEQYSQDPDIMAQVQMQTQDYVRHNMLQDAEMGLPKDGWSIYVDFQNYYEAAWFGCDVQYRDGQVPDTEPILHSENKRMLFDRGIPDPFTGGAMARAWDFYEHMKNNMGSYSHRELPVVNVGPPPGLWTDGPRTVACSLRGATEMCLEIYEDPDYARELLRYITESTITRIKAYREHLGQEMKPQCWGFADDSIELLSVDIYTEFVLPMHRLLLQELAGEGPHSIHLCGNAQRFMTLLKEELNITIWDTGYPVDFGKARKDLGPDYLIQGGPRVSLLLHGSPEEVKGECKRILESGVMEGGRFILREGNNLSPGTPVENVAAMYEAAHAFGNYES